MSNAAAYTYRDENSGLEFQWHGGEYIEVGYTAQEDVGPFNNLGQPSWEAGQFVASDVINVWDYEASEPRIDRSLDAFEERCREWLEGDDE